MMNEKILYDILSGFLMGFGSIALLITCLALAEWGVNIIRKASEDDAKEFLAFIYIGVCVTILVFGWYAWFRLLSNTV